MQFAPGDSNCAAQQFVDYVQRNHARKHRVTKGLENASYGLGGLKRRGSASICEGVVPSAIACTRVIDCIHAGVKIAWTATKAARSSRSLRACRISINPKTTAVNTVRAVAMFATVERSTAAICSNASFHVTQIWSCVQSD